MKKLLTLLMVLVMLLSCFACSKGGDGSVTSNEQSSNNEESSAETTDGVGNTTPPDNFNSTLSYDMQTYQGLFDTPTSEFRWYLIEHTVAHQYRNNTWKSNVEYLKKKGFGGVVLNYDFAEGYLQNKEVFNQLGLATDILNDNGLGMWVYDEYGYPSGSAGGLTTYEHPEYVAKGLVYIRKSGNGYREVAVRREADFLKIHSAYAVDKDGNVTNVTVSDDQVVFGGLEGEWTLYVFAEKKLYEGTHAETNSGGGVGWLTRDYLNIMDKNAVAEFINNTYKAYAENFKHFSNAGAVFTDEPSLMEKYQNTGKTFKYGQLAWSDDFAQKFEEMHSYSILTNLHHMFEGNSDEAKIVRVNYRQTVAELVGANYFGQINDFCVENGTLLSGHCLLEENLSDHVYYYGDLLQCLRQTGIPGVDVLTGKPEKFQSTSTPHYLTIKYAYSVAAMKGNNTVMLELAPTDYLSSERLTSSELNEIFQVLSLMYFNGANHINSYLGVDSLSYKTKTYNEYFARLAYISKTAKWNGGVAVYYPINTSQAYSIPSTSATVGKPNTDPHATIAKLCLKLYEEQRDYLVVDNQFIREATVEDGKIYNENVCFTSICLPGVEVMPLDVLKKVLDFQNGGGTVVWVESVPQIADKLSENEELKSLTAALTSVSVTKAVKTIDEADPLKLEIKKRTSSLYVGTYTLDDAPMYWLYNNHEMKKTLDISYEGAIALDVYDPKTGEITRYYGDSIKLEIDAYYTKMITVVY